MVLEIGDRVPIIELTDDAGEPSGFGSYQGNKLIAFFYPKAMTPGCTAEACGFRDNYRQFLKAGYDVVGVSPDSPSLNSKFRDRDALPFRLLSDPDHIVSIELGSWGLKKNYGKEYEGLIRSTFVIDEAGALTHVWRNVRAKGHVDRVARELLG